MTLKTLNIKRSEKSNEKMIQIEKIQFTNKVHSKMGIHNQQIMIDISNLIHI